MRLHLSSFVLGILFLAAMLGVNLRWHRILMAKQKLGEVDIPVIFIQEWGVPFTINRFTDKLLGLDVNDPSLKLIWITQSQYLIEYNEMPDPSTREEKWILSGIALNAGLSIGFVGLIVYMIERKSKKALRSP